MCFFPSNLKDWVDVIKDIATLLALVVGAAWAWWQFNLFRERHSKMELSFEIAHLGSTKHHHIIEIQGEASNKGKRSQTLYHLQVQIWGYAHNGKPMFDFGKNVKFPIELDNYIFYQNPDDPNEVSHATVDGGNTFKFTYLAAIDIKIEWASISTRYFLTEHGSDREFVDLRKTCSLVDSTH